MRRILDAIFVLSHENDFIGNAGTDGWESAAGCCDSPLLPNGYVFLRSNGTPDGNAWSCPLGANPACQYGGGLIPAIVVTRNGPRGFVSNQPYNHYSLLRAIEENWGLPYLGNASDSAQVHSMSEFLGR